MPLQGILYTLVLALTLMTAVALARIAAQLLYRWLVSPDPHPFLAFPRLETTVAGLVLVALCFYACLVLGSASAGWTGSSHLAAILVLCLLVGPFAAFLWWLALARMVYTPVRCHEGSKVRHVLALSFSDPCSFQLSDGVDRRHT